MVHKYKLYLSDLDNTLVEPIVGAVFPVSVNDRQLIQGRKDKLDELKAQGNIICIVTNQGGCAWKFFTEKEMDSWLDTFCKAYNIDKYLVCYHDTREKAMQYLQSRPELLIAELVSPDLTTDGYERRKPGPGMLIEAIEHFGVSREETLMIGDRKEDEGAAISAGVDFIWADKFFQG